MCEFCKEHGEGKKWYLQINNYLEERLTEEEKKFPYNLYENLEKWAAENWAIVDSAPNRSDIVGLMLDEMKKTHWGQVVPLEDVEEIFDMSINLVRIPCPCRQALRGVREHRTCYHAVASPSQFWRDIFDQWPDVSANLDVVNRQEAKKEFAKFDEKGLVHTVWSFGTPFLGAICNCTPMDCLSMKSMAYGHRPLFKAEYVAAIDINKCNGCRTCPTFCHFAAIGYSSALERCTIKQKQCFGCGLCRAVCPKDAITLLDRNAIPALAKEW